MFSDNVTRASSDIQFIQREDLQFVGSPSTTEPKWKIGIERPNIRRECIRSDINGVLSAPLFGFHSDYFWARLP